MLAEIVSELVLTLSERKSLLPSHDPLAQTSKILKRSVGTLSVLRRVDPDVLVTAEVELDTYRDAAISLETKAKTLEEHLSAIATLLPEVRKETCQLKGRNKRAYTILKKLLHGRRVDAPPTPKSKPVPPAPTEGDLVIMDTPSKATRRNPLAINNKPQTTNK